MKYKAAIFDLDGTLLDTLDDLHDAVNHTMNKYSYPERTLDEVCRFVGNGVDRLITLCVPGHESDPSLAAAIGDFRDYYAAHSEIKTKPYPGVIELIDRLMKSGVKAAIVSNKMHEAVVTLCRKYFPQVEVVCGEREREGVRRKPAPDTVIKAAENLGVNLSDVVYIGDSEVDLKTSENAGVDCISVLWGFRGRECLINHGAKIFAQTADQVYSIIAGEN